MTRLDGTITHFEFLGASVRYGVAIGTNEVLVDVAHQSGAVPLDPGSAIAVDLDHSRALFLAA